MKKILIIALKDLRTAFRDPAALVMMLVTPFAITLAAGFAFGGIGGSSQNSGGLADIPVILVNHDGGEFSDALVDVFYSPDLAELVEPSLLADQDQARQQVDDDLAAAVVVIPAGFSDSILPSSLTGGNVSGEEMVDRPQSTIEIYTNPTRPVSVGVVQSIVDRFLSRVNAAQAGAETTFTQLSKSGALSYAEAETIAEQIGRQTGEEVASTELVSLEIEMVLQGETTNITSLSFIAPSLAIIFLMFTVTAGGRSILAERKSGTLPRLLTTPSISLQVLTGKALGIYLIGLAQMTILILAGAILLKIEWGDPLALAALLLSLVAGASGWGMLLAAYARTPAQASNVGTAMTLVFAVAGGNFVPRPSLPEWLQTISYLTPNALGIEGFMELLTGGGLVDLLPYLLVLIATAFALFGLAALAFRRQYR